MFYLKGPHVCGPRKKRRPDQTAKEHLMKLKAIRKEARLDVRLYRRQRKKLDKFCKINNISPSQLIRNVVEGLDVIERTVTSGPLQKAPERNPQRSQSGDYRDN